MQFPRQFRNSRGEVLQYPYGNYQKVPVQIFRHPSKQTMFKNFPISDVGNDSPATPLDCWKFLQDNTSDDDLMELMCGFCKANGERPLIYNSHMLKIGDYIVCPVLRNCVCVLCSQKGHTMGHCKVNPNNGSVIKRLFNQSY